MQNISEFEFPPHLNSNQINAVKLVDQSLLILAGVGTGKTETLMTKFAYLAQKCGDYSKILAVTFTNKAANEMKDRVQKILGKNFPSQPWIGTFHSLSLRFLKLNCNFKVMGLKKDFRIADEKEARKYVGKTLKKLKESDDQSILYRLQNVINIGYCKGGLKEALQILIERVQLFGFIDGVILDSQCQMVLLKIYPIYQQLMRADNLIDYGDLLLSVRQLSLIKSKIEILRNLFDYVLVDEAQDLNQIQYLWIQKLLQDNKNVTYVGDDDQIIYGFNGSDGKLNYRSTKTIINLANNLISHNKNRHQKNLWTDNQVGDNYTIQRYKNEDGQASDICRQIKKLIDQKAVQGSQIAILTRTNIHGDIFEKELTKHKIPFVFPKKTQEMLKLNEIKLAYNFLSVLFDPEDSYSFEQVLLCLPGMGPATCLKLATEAEELDISVKELIKIILKQRETKIFGSMDLEEEEYRSLLRSMQILDLNGQNDSSSIMQSTIMRRVPSQQSIIPESDQLQQMVANTVLNRKQIASVQLLLEALQMSEGIAVQQVHFLTQYLNKLNFLKICWKKAKFPKDEKVIKSNVMCLIDKMSQFDSFKEFSELYQIQDESISDYDQLKIDDRNRVRLITIHKSKGLEFEHVFLPYWSQGNIPFNIRKNEDPQEFIEEERRIAFVGLTRAKFQVHFSYCCYEYNARYNKSYQKQPSQFLEEMQDIAQNQLLGRDLAINNRRI
ncbi:atp-dependent dna helicase [Stylonychia lemnae]|uniref:DNA 3'-5' helicase n=1 Tax=Stylonychia lemnae TaxID=5949 RepID=A0A078AZ29_STYLE|nr:atp-dependent dna helicase [Stylonychia lemnae]|eukprot:CDW86462.1 atp-dependent dna helicase [Stylonychia lemnae]